MGQIDESKISAIIDQDCHFKGDLSFNGIVRIAGKVEGSIFSNDTLIISEGAVIDADIVANVVLISGNVTGNIQAKSRVEINFPARFEGSIVSPSLIVEEGVIFHGTTKMEEKKQNLS